ncbi:alanine racemase [Pontibacillus salipaludis]|uniref:alanine racemase n=1 Tax=Pontibacillus salipaludis TaxID=1697394 RepID=UPI0031ED36D3
MAQYYRDSWIEVELDAIQGNIQNLKQHLPKKTGVYAVVKANAYGHGDVQVAKAALEGGASGLAVALLDEAVRLREVGITAPILVMGWTRPEDVAVAAHYDITLTVFQAEWLREIKAMNMDQVLSFHIKLDTGMGRIGIRETHELEEVLKECKGDGPLLKGVFTHFATADEEETSYVEEQQRRFDALMETFTSLWDKPIEVHTGNSALSMRFPEKMNHIVRFGISMYGLYPSKEVKAIRPIELSPSFSLHSKLVHTKKVPAGESISYGATYTTSEEEWIGTIPIGYADGWIRKLQGIEVLINGKRMPIIGRICMDQCMVELDQAYPVGTQVTLIGKQGKEEIEVDEIADYLDTINYEIPCMMSERVPRVFLKDKKVIDVYNGITFSHGKRYGPV